MDRQTTITLIIMGSLTSIGVSASIYYGPIKTELISTVSIKYTAINDRKRGVLLKSVTTPHPEG
jgi:hypothetical protein